MIECVHSEFVSRAGERVRYNARFRPTSSRKPLVIFLHGFKGFKDWGPFPFVCEQVALAGFVVASLNFSHNGVGADGQSFTELARFGRNTISRELEEIADAIDHFRDPNLSFASEIDYSTIALLGHSRGGAEAILAGERSPFVQRVIAWAPVSTFHRYTQRQKEEWRREGRLTVKNMRTGQDMWLDLVLLEDLLANEEKLDILRAASRLGASRKALCIVHGEQDLTVPRSEAMRLHKAAGRASILHMLPKTNHSFGAEHPFDGKPSDALTTAIEITIEFLHSEIPL